MPAWVVEGTTEQVQEYNDLTYALIANTNPFVIGNSVESIALSPDSTVLYVGDTNTGLITSFHAGTLVNIASTTLAIGSASRITVYPSTDGTLLFVAERGANKVWVLNPVTLATITTFNTVSNAPTGMTQLASGGHLYIACESSAAVEVRLGISPWTLLTTITVGTDPLVVLSNSTGTTVYCLNILAETVSVITTSSNTVSSTVTLTGGTAPLVEGMSISPDDKYLYLTSGSTGTDAWIVVTATLTETHFSTTAANEFSAVTSDGLRAWLTVASPSTVEIYNVPANTLAHTITGTGGGVVVTLPNPFKGTTPTPPTYPGATFIPKLFIPQKGKVIEDYTPAEFMANWVAIELWSQRWKPAPPVLFFPRKGSHSNANWLIMEEWANQIRGLGAPYVPLFIPRKNSERPFDLDIDFLRIQNWANLIAHG